MNARERSDAWVGWLFGAFVCAALAWVFGYGCARQGWIDAYTAECVKLGGRVMETGDFYRHCVAHADTLHAGPKP